jgi:sigma-B regulation protein RsbU (phosphoserine phosphatase)
VGGDFYDVIRLDDDRCAIVIADVSDKGMPAALFMGLSRSLILAEARRSAAGTASPTEVLSNVNDLLLELGGAQMFVTVFYGVLDRRARRLVYARAGHERPALIRPGVSRAPVEAASNPAPEVSALPGDGAILGFLPRNMLGLSDCALDLRAGDRLVLYTDGLVDTFSPDGQALGRDRLMRLLAECSDEAGDAGGPDAFCAGVFELLLRHRGEGEQFDDMAMLVVDVTDSG